MIRPLALAGLLALAACGGGAPAGPAAPRAVAAATGTCPAPDPIRDGPLVDAIRARDATPVRAALARDGGDTRARAALAVITGDGAVDPAEAACFAPYF